MRDAVEVAPRKWMAPPAFAATVFVFQMQFGQSAPLVAFMAALGALCVFTSATLREAEYEARKAQSGLSRRDIFGYACATLFDTALLIALVTGVGLWTMVERFATLFAFVAVPVVIVIWWRSRSALAPQPAESKIRYRHWIGPLFLLLGAASIWLAQGVQSPSGSQLFVFLVLLSVNIASLELQPPFTGFARVARFSILGLTMVLLVWNYLQIT